MQDTFLFVLIFIVYGTKYSIFIKYPSCLFVRRAYTYMYNNIVNLFFKVNS